PQRRLAQPALAITPSIRAKPNDRRDAFPGAQRQQRQSAVDPRQTQRLARPLADPTQPPTRARSKHFSVMRSLDGGTVTIVP
ncbi:MAG: hypothetical protein OXE75_12895, partial [bacterium]|nr:hypothetical protein [bacterium]